MFSNLSLSEIQLYLSRLSVHFSNNQMHFFWLLGTSTNKQSANLIQKTKGSYVTQEGAKALLVL